MGLRNVSVGVDTSSYMQMFNNVSNMSIGEIFSYNAFFDKIGFVLLMKLCSSVVDNYFFFQLVISFCYCFGMKRFFEKSGMDIFPVSIIFIGSGLYLGAFNVCRELLAVMLLVNGWNYLLEKKYKKMAALYIIAISIHVTALCFVFASAIYWLKDHKYFFRIAPIIIGIVGGAYRVLIYYAAKFFPINHNNYGNWKTVQNADVGLAKIIWLIIAFIAIYGIYFRRYDKIESIYAIFSLTYVMTNFVGMYFNYFERIGTYFQPFSVLLFWMFKYKIRSKAIRNVYSCGVIISFTIYFLISGLTSAQYQYVTFLH
jgi:hypothetical protein